MVRSGRFRTQSNGCYAEEFAQVSLTAPTDSVLINSRERSRNLVAIAVVSLAGLLLEVGYTRIVSYKLWYYYTYLVIGLALLGIGSGGIAVTLIPALKRASSRSIIALCSIWGAITTLGGTFVIAKLRIDTARIWSHDDWTQARSALKQIASLGIICFAIFATFVSLGIILSTLLGRAREDIGKLYFADLAAAGLACVIAIPLISAVGPPTVVIMAAALFLGVGLVFLPRTRGFVVVAHGLIGGLTAVVLVAMLINNSLIPSIIPDTKKMAFAPSENSSSDWGPVFRVDALEVPNPRPDWPVPGTSWLLLHDATFGAGMHRFDGDAAALTYYDTDPRRIPFEVLGTPPRNELIIGSAGGNEILASLHFGAKDIDAVELNPVTVEMLKGDFADETGHLAEREDVHLHQGDGRTYLARSYEKYDLIWFVAPDSYAANNAASSGSFVLSESYLYTSEMIAESLEHLSDNGLVVVQFGELRFANKEHPEQARPNRTSRYLATARHAMNGLDGFEEPENHILVAVEESAGAQPAIVLKRTPFTEQQVADFAETVPQLKDTRLVYAPGVFNDGSFPARIAGATDEKAVAEIVASYPGEIGPITDDGPFFWHFKNYRTVLGEMTNSWDGLDPEDSIGERVLVLLLGFAILYAAAFLLVPFIFVRKKWRALPAKGPSAIFFACLGFGFMFYEISMIQRLVQFLGYPTMSLTVTLATILITTGIGALVSKRYSQNPTRALIRCLGALGVLTIAYRYGLAEFTDSLLGASVGLRILVSIVVLAPLGFCLGMFMPLGLGTVSQLGDDGESYTAWAWAVNGFFSVIGSVLTTILAMEFGFSTVQAIAWFFYVIAALSFVRLNRRVSQGHSLVA